jgi:NADPH-dependent ferric siderophore reductase
MGYAFASVVETVQLNKRLRRIVLEVPALDRLQLSKAGDAAVGIYFPDANRPKPDTRTLNNHRRPPDLQMWLYQRECSPTPATHESFCSTRPSASASPHTVYRTSAEPAATTMSFFRQ